MRLIVDAIKSLINRLLGNRNRQAAPDKNSRQTNAARKQNDCAREIEPKNFFYWAGSNPERWKLLIGASIRHKSYGRGGINGIHRVDASSQILLSVLLDGDARSKIFHASDFRVPGGPFFELLVDTACSDEFQKGLNYVPAVGLTGVQGSQLKDKEPQKKRILQPSVDLSRCKPDWFDFAQIIASYQIEALYHFTDYSNIASIIEKGGLYSWWYCDSNHISISKPGGNDLSRDLDRHKGLQDYVRLSFNSHSPMLSMTKQQGRIDRPCILEISPEVIYWNSSLFSSLNATSSSSEIGGSLASFKKIDFGIATAFSYDDETKSRYQAEVMIKTHIPLKYILKIPQI